MLVAALVMVLGICAALSAADRIDDRWTADAAVPVAASLRDFRAVAHAHAVPAPVRVRIPAIGVNARLERLGMARGRMVAPPRRWARRLL